jgi:NAD+ synthetase
MKVFNEQVELDLPDELKQALSFYRKQRGFEAPTWVKAKSYILNEYMRASRLNTVVVAVSGGVDSALVLSLVNFASKVEKSPIKKIVAINLPAMNNAGATGQDKSYERALDLCQGLGLELLTINVSPIQSEIISLAEGQLGLKADDWAKGQTVAYSRTPVLYGMTSILSANGFSSIIGGTTNRDEGAYLGYVGKASDGMVDVQLISDLHKSEVYASAQYLNVPQSIMNAVCTGDMFDGRVDEEVFGTSYDFVELYLWYLNLSSEEQTSFKNKLSISALERFELYAKNLENLHSYNAHKYLAGSPAVHLDIFESNIKGGWQIQKNTWLEQLNLVPDTAALNHLGKFTKEFDKEILKEMTTEDLSVSTVHDIGVSKIITIDNFFSNDFIETLYSEITNNSLESINEMGGKINVDASYLNKSKRINVYDTKLSKLIWHKVKSHLPSIEEMNEYSYCDNQGHIYWKPIGINPYVKLNQYNECGLLVAHYDGAHEYNEKHKNIKTLIIYLENNDAATRIIDDHQSKIENTSRVFIDGTKDDVISLEDILFNQPSQKNRVMIFDNKLLHDSTLLKSGRKTILLTEVVYEKLTSPQYSK